ncbi:MAG: hypothetical protein J6V62_03185 [Paludibacteraceae bacterium]|nr:hypothetical protein [Paludibacteraceae bacterium]
MSYTQNFRRRVAVPYSGSVSVSYPASQNGGTTTAYYSGTAYEDVDVEIYVDTVPFDDSVVGCNASVGGLTTSVAAMNAAQCASIRENAEKVSSTIINGFFQTVRTDLSAQKAELQQTVNARLILLNEQKKSLLALQKKMSEDYARTSARYLKIFNDLNDELSNRIHQIDQHVFDFAKNVEDQSNRMLKTDMIQCAVTAGKESSLLQAQLNVALMKQHALQAMSQAQNFLVNKAVSERTIQQSIIDGEGTDRYYVPVCYMRTEDKAVEQKCVVPEYYSAAKNVIEQKIVDNFEQMEMPFEKSEDLKSYVKAEVAQNIPNNDAHSERVRDLIIKMLNE